MSRVFCPSFIVLVIEDWVSFVLRWVGFEPRSTFDWNTGACGFNEVIGMNPLDSKVQHDCDLDIALAKVKMLH